MGNKNWTAINNATPRQPGTLLPFVMLGLINSHLLPLPTSTMYICQAISSCKKKRVTDQITEAWSSLLLPKLSYLSKSLIYRDTYLFWIFKFKLPTWSFFYYDTVYFERVLFIFNEFILYCVICGSGSINNFIKSSEITWYNVIFIHHYFHGQNQTKKH